MDNLGISRVLQYIIAAVLLIASISKLVDPYPFGTYLDSLNILQSNYIIPTAYTISILELLLSLLLIINYKNGLIVSTFLIVISVATIYSMWLYLSGIQMNCGCFGGFLDRKIGLTYFIGNGFLILGMLIYLALTSTHLKSFASDI